MPPSARRRRQRTRPPTTAHTKIRRHTACLESHQISATSAPLNTQRPSVDIIPKSLRDLFGYRAACRCTSAGSSDIILGDGWSGAGFSATDISPVNPGEALLIAEGGIPQRIKAAYLSDDDIRALADYAAWTRRTHRLTPAGPATAVA